MFVVDEFRFWQDRHLPGTTAYAEDEEILETLAFVLPTEHRNIITIVASQGDIPQKLSGGGQGDRFIPLYLLADKNKSDFGEIVTFRCREVVKGGAVDIKDYYDLCRKEYKFIKQGNISVDYFTAIFPFQPRTFEVMRRITQNAEKHNLPTARSAIRMAWQTLCDDELLKGTRLITMSDMIRSDELRKGLNHEHYHDDFQGLQGAIDQLPDLDLSPGRTRASPAGPGNPFSLGPEPSGQPPRRNDGPGGGRGGVAHGRGRRSGHARRAHPLKARPGRFSRQDRK